MPAGSVDEEGSLIGKSQSRWSNECDRSTVNSSV